jgi:hypothetical protein
VINGMYCRGCRENKRLQFPMWSGFQHVLGLLEAGYIHAKIHHRGHLGKHRYDRIDEFRARCGLDFLLGHRPEQMETAPHFGTQPLRLASAGVEVLGGVIIFVI